MARGSARPVSKPGSDSPPVKRLACRKGVATPPLKRQPCRGGFTPPSVLFLPKFSADLLSAHFASRTLLRGQPPRKRPLLFPGNSNSYPSRRRRERRIASLDDGIVCVTISYGRSARIP